MDAVAITLNGTPVSGRPGMTILELAREVGVKIPTLCHDPTLKPVGACRICLVEDEKSGKLLPSCVTSISPGMVIQTESSAVIENRKVIVELMLASHPESCLLCEKGNRCRLRSLAAELGIGAVQYYPMPHFSETQEVNPFILRDLSKCILCSKCIRADHELVVTGALDYLHRGFDAKPATTFDGPLESSECTFCGTCVSLCPTGALFERNKPHLGTVSNRTPSVCAYCGCGCNILLETHEDRLISVVPDPQNDLNGKTLCVRGRYGTDYIHHPERLKTPLIRKDGILQEADWDEALDFVAAGLMKCHAANGPDAMAFFGSSKGTNEENYIFQKIARSVFHTNNIDNAGRLHSGPSLEAIPSGTMTGPIRGLENSDVILVAGADPSASHPIVSYAIKRAVRLNGAQLIVLDPRRTELAGFAALWVPIRPGSDSLLIAEILHFAGSSRPATGISDPGGFERRTGCSPGIAEKISAMLRSAKSPGVAYGHGITGQPGAAVSARLLAALARATGAAVYPLDKESNSQGAWDMGCMPDRFPGHLPVEDPENMARFESFWGAHLPGKPGLTATGMILGAEAGTVKSLYVMGENPVRAIPDAPRVASALSRIEFLVVQDLFPTETSKYAHAVLPSCSFAEKNGTFTNIEGRVQRIRRAIPPLHQSRSDLDILCMLSCRLRSPATYRSPDEVLAEISSIVPQYAGIAEGLKRGSVFRPSVSGERPQPAPEAFEGTALPPTAPSKTGEFTLLRGSTLFQYLHGTRSARSSRLSTIQPPGYVEISVSDAAHLAVQEGDTLIIQNDMAEVRKSARISRALPEGVLFCPFSEPDISALFALGHAGEGVVSCSVRLKKSEQ
ncbi:MAG: molybdopterin-dependent oxidoreductase [Desulfobacteraceae bacterium]|nr:molybdopterin-dependent oxidoreductase [Desulfobacteraceae bacterium]